MSDLPTCTASLKRLRMFTLVVIVGDTATLSAITEHLVSA